MNEMDRDTEREHLQALLTSEGWQVFLALVGREWGAQATMDRIQSACAAILPSGQAGEQARETVLQITACRTAVEKALNLPVERLRTLQRSAATREIVQPVEWGKELRVS